MKINKPLILLLFTLFTLPIFAKDKNAKAIAEIKEVLQKQEQGWNSGDLGDFMRYYWNSPELKFVSKNGVKEGWQEVYEGYVKNYAAKGDMGKLNFELQSIDQVNGKNYLVTGSWKVENKSGEHKGYFTLWFKKIKSEWLIVMDHSS